MSAQHATGNQPTGSYRLYSECGGGDGSRSCATSEGCSIAGPGPSTRERKEIVGDASGHVIDTVNHPPHYNQGGIECIDAIQAALTPEEFRGYCKGNALKYTWRERIKGQDESLKKALWYLNRAQKG
jgi:hypothetical protein